MGEIGPVSSCHKSLVVRVPEAKMQTRTEQQYYLKELHVPHERQFLPSL